MITVFSDDAVSLAALRGRRVVIVGYGNQARAQARNLRDSGIAVTVALRARGRSRVQARADRFVPVTLREGARRADVLLLLIPDERHVEVYAALESFLPRGAAIGFAHGFSLAFAGLKPRSDLDVFLVAPAGPGTELRAAFERGGGIPALLAVQQDATGGAASLALAYAKAIGCTRAAAVWTSVHDEAVIDLFGEQTVLCGGVAALVSTAYRTLVASGYPAELAYLECAQQLRLTVDLLHERGPEGLRDAISTTALYGMRETERALEKGGLAKVMRRRLEEIESGAFARRFARAVRAGEPRLTIERDLSESEKEMASSGRAVRSLFLRGKAGAGRPRRTRNSS